MRALLFPSFTALCRGGKCYLRKELERISHKTKYKIQRALGVELPGLGKEGALEKRNYPPGQHGQNRRSKPSEFALQLREKQKVMFHYGLREEQLRRFVRQARTAGHGNWIEALLSLLERRLDNVVFRLGFARSIAAARQLVSHGHVLLNGRSVNIGSIVLRVGDFIRLTEYAAGTMTEGARTNPRLELPAYLKFALPESNTHGTLLFLPGSEHVPFPLNPRQVAEYYAQRGV